MFLYLKELFYVECHKITSIFALPVQPLIMELERREAGCHEMGHFFSTQKHENLKRPRDLLPWPANRAIVT